MVTEALALMNPWWEGRTFDTGIEREKYLQQLQPLLQAKGIIFLTGLRRVGKTTLLKQLIKGLLETVNSPFILYLTLDFIAFKGKTIHDLVQEFRQMHGHKIDQPIYLFLDEVTYIPSYEQELKNFYDLEQVKIIASSSSASLLKSKNSFLVGRSRFFEIVPLDFEEYLQFKKIVVGKAERYLLPKYFDEYLQMGGLPEYVLTGDPQVIKGTVEQIIYKDIITLHDIKEKDSVERLFLLLCERVGKPLTYAKLARVLGLSVDSIRRYISYFRDTFLFYAIDKYAKSLNERTYSPKKMYIADTGIRTVFAGSRDKGALFENMVFLKIKDKNPHYFYERGKEIDFIIEWKKEKIALEVKYKEKVDADELTFFNESKFSKKILVQGVQDLTKLEELSTRT